MSVRLQHFRPQLEKAQLERVVTALVAARRRHMPLAAFPPNAVPKSLDDAYAVQEAFTRRWSSPVVGYKVGAASPEAQRRIGASTPFAARIFLEDCFASPATVRARDFFAVGVEAAFAFRLGRDLPARPGLSRAEAAEAVAEIICAIEICDTRLSDWKAAGLFPMIADNGFQGGLVMGDAQFFESARDLAAQPAPRVATLSIDGTVIGQEAGRAVATHPLDSLAWLAGELGRRNQSLRTGDIVTTGTCLSPHCVTAPATIAADFGAIGRVEMKLVP